jgi:hypothetical protein
MCGHVAPLLFFRDNVQRHNHLRRKRTRATVALLLARWPPYLPHLHQGETHTVKTNLVTSAKILPDFLNTAIVRHARWRAA